MKVETKMSEKDKKLLRILFIVLVAVGFVFLGIRPLLDKASSIKTEVEAQEALQAVNQEKILKSDSLDALCESMETQTEELTRDYYGNIQSSDVDSFLTGMVLEYELEAKSMVITMPTEAYAVEPYVYSELAQTGYTSESTVVQDTFAVGGDTTSATAGDADETDETDSTETATEDASGGLNAITVELTVLGDKEKAGALLDHVSKECPGIRIISYEWDENTVQNTAEDLSVSLEFTHTLKMKMEIYTFTEEDGE